MPPTVSVRMYDVGFGDCFLISVVHDKGVWRMLVDCGSHSQGRSRPLSEVVANVIEDLEAVADDGVARLDVVVATHRHADHIQGFADQQWSAVEVGEVWLPYVENPDDPATGEFRSDASRIALGVQRAVALQANRFTRDDRVFADFAASLALNALTNDEAVQRLHGDGLGFAPATRTETRFWPDPVAARNTFSPAPGVTVHVLGPSRNPEDLRRMDPPKSAAWLRLGDDEDDGDAAVRPLFNSRFEVGPRELPKELLSAWKPMGLRKLNDSVGMLAAAVRLDQVVNNTSLFLLLDVNGCKVLLPGDAQQGAWEHVLGDPANKELLADARLYKIAHHGSDNATPREFVEQRWKAEGYAMLPWGPVKIWPSIPKSTLMKALAARHKVVRRDVPLPADPEIAAEPGRWTQVTMTTG